MEALTQISKGEGGAEEADMETERRRGLVPFRVKTMAFRGRVKWCLMVEERAEADG